MRETQKRSGDCVSKDKGAERCRRHPIQRCHIKYYAEAAPLAPGAKQQQGSLGIRYIHVLRSYIPTVHNRTSHSVGYRTLPVGASLLFVEVGGGLGVERWHPMRIDIAGENLIGESALLLAVGQPLDVPRAGARSTVEAFLFESNVVVQHVGKERTVPATVQLQY